MFEIVKLVDSDEYPSHNENAPLERKEWAIFRGKEIAIGPGVIPRPCWKCDTKLVYPVTNETLARMGFQPESYGITFVCEHQFKRVPKGEAANV